MSAATSVPGPTPPQPGRGGPARPAKPPSSKTMVVGVLAAVGITALTVAPDPYGIGLNPAELWRDAGNSAEILFGEQGLANPSWANLDRVWGPLLETFQIAIIAAPIGVTLALLLAFLASPMSNRGVALYRFSRALMSVMRSIPDVLYALIAVAMFSIGALPGIVAIALFDIGVVSKLTSESVDAIDPGPLEAADAAGASGMQRVRTAVLPQVLPNYLAYSLYAFEINLRASLVLGFVGAGGIGQLLRLAYTNYRYDVIALLVIVIFVIVFLVEALSITLRRRLV